jgi:hypothetical protein
VERQERQKQRVVKSFLPLGESAGGPGGGGAVTV